MVQIQLEDHVAAALIDQARAHGLSLQDYLMQVATRKPISLPGCISGDEALCLIDAEASAGNSTYQGTYSREDIYLDHD